MPWETKKFLLLLIFNVYKSSLSTSIQLCISFLFFLSSQHICQSYFHCFILHLASRLGFVFQFMLQLVSFLTGKYNFWFPLFARSIYSTLFLLHCFDFCLWVYMCIFSHTFYSCYKLLPRHCTFAALCFPFFLSSSRFFLFSRFNFNF